MRRPVHLFLVLALPALLAGCAAGPREVPRDRDGAWERHRDRLSALESWQAEGRLAVRTVDDGGQANFTWREREGDRFVLRLAGPWGQGAARLEGSGSRAELRAADGRRFAGADARDLLFGVYGWDIPVSALRRWLLGLPTAGAQFRLDRFGRLLELEWRDWSLQYRRYRQAGGLDLPALLVARRQRDDVELRVAVDTWRLDAERDAAPQSPIPLFDAD